MLQSSVEQMVHSLLMHVLAWAHKHNVPVEAGAWEQAVTSAREPVIPAAVTAKTRALIELMNGIQHPTVVVWGARTLEHLCMNALSLSAGRPVLRLGELQF